jgi:hypothetical protein
MALTEGEETKVRSIITAFDGAKRVSELPAGVTGSPFELTLEVLDKDGETKQSPLATMLPYIEDQVSYGVEIDTAVSASALTRVGSTDLHKRLPIQSRMKGCILSDAGVVIQYLHPTNWSGFTLDGSIGQIMVEIPDHYRKFITSGTKTQARISEHPIPGYHLVKKMYISAFEASIQRSTGKLCSMVNAAADYRGGDNTAAWDATYRSLLGRPVTSISRTAFRTAARLRNADTKWNCQDYNAYKAMYWLYTIEYANTNSQLTVNAALDANGYKQGGLGNGVTDWDGTWGTFNSYNPFVPCGHTNSLGNQSGELSYAIKDTDGTTTLKTVYANRYRGVENPFGHVWKWTDGINIEVGASESKVYVANDPVSYNDDNYTGYTNRGLQARSAGYISKMIIGEFGELIASEVSGGSTTGWCDYFYTDTNQALRGLLSGGYSHAGAYAGFGCSNASNAPSIANTYIGSRLCYIPA